MAYSSQKKKMMQLVHIGKNKLGLDDATYRHMLFQVTGKESSKDFTVVALRKVINHMEQHSFKMMLRQWQTYVSS